MVMSFTGMIQQYYKKRRLLNRAFFFVFANIRFNVGKMLAKLIKIVNVYHLKTSKTLI